MSEKLLRGLVALLAVAGMVVSFLALRVHNMDPAAIPPCAVNATWDCGKVNHSPYSVFPPHSSFDEDTGPIRVHVPIATLGIIAYGCMAVVALFGRWWILLQFVEIGFAFACLLSYLEAYVIRAWCIYCVWSQGIVTAILLTTIGALVVRHRTRRAARLLPTQPVSS